MKKFIYRLLILVTFTVFQVIENKLFDTEYLIAITTVLASYYTYNLINKLP